MKLTCVTLLVFVAAATASPINNFRFRTDDFSNEQSLEVLSNAVTGHYTFMTPEGIEFFVRYIADARGFRILESNALPQRRPSAAGVQQQRSRQAVGNNRVQQRSNQGLGNNRVQQRSNQGLGNNRVQQRNRQAFRAPSRRFESRESRESKESFELFDSDERRF